MELDKQKRLEELEDEKRKYEAEKEVWDVKVSRIKEEIKVLKTTMSKHEEDQKITLKRQKKSNHTFRKRRITKWLGLQQMP